jgi:putative phage-type endonuclease
VNTTELDPMADREAWLAERRTYLGATDVSAILRLHPYRTPRAVYLEKMGSAPDVPMNEAMRWGVALEPVIGARYAEDTGYEIAKGVTVRHPAVPYFAASPDYIITRGVNRLLEVKTAGHFAGKDFGTFGTDEVPVQYLVQCQWQMFIVNAWGAAMGFTGDVECVDLAVLIGGQDFRIYTVRRDDALISELVAQADAWWQTYIMAECPPPLTDGDEDLMDAAFPADNGTVIAATPEIERICAVMRRAKSRVRRWVALTTECEVRVKEYMGEAAVMTTSLADKPVTWRTGKPKAKTDWQAVASDRRRGVPLKKKIAQATTETPGARVFRTPFNGEKE